MTEEEQLLLEWKKAYGYVYYAEISGIDFIYRTVGMKEYLELQQMAEDTLALDELLCAMCVLDPILEDWGGDIYAGFPRMVAKAIREASGLESEGEEIALMEIIEQEKEKVYNKLVYQIPLIIKHCFPELSFVAIEEMSMREQGEYYARALWMLENFENNTLQAKKD